MSPPWLGGHDVLQLHSGFCCEPPRSSHGLCRKYIASRLKGLDPWKYRQFSQAQRKVDKMSVHINFTLEARGKFFSLHMIFSLKRAAVIWAIQERISGFDHSSEMTAPRYTVLEVLHCF